MGMGGCVGSCTTEQKEAWIERNSTGEPIMGSKMSCAVGVETYRETAIVLNSVTATESPLCKYLVAKLRRLTIARRIFKQELLLKSWSEHKSCVRFEDEQDQQEKP